MIKLIDILNEIRVNKPLHFPKDKEWIYYVKNKEEYERITPLLDGNFRWHSNQSFLNYNPTDAYEYPFYIAAREDRDYTLALFDTLTRNADKKILLNPGDAPNITEIRVNRPNITKREVIDYMHKNHRVLSQHIGEVEMLLFKYRVDKNTQWQHIIDSLPQGKLNQFYNELLNIKNLNEIQVNRPGISHESVQKLFDEMHNKGSRTDNFSTNDNRNEHVLRMNKLIGEIRQIQNKIQFSSWDYIDLSMKSFNQEDLYNIHKELIAVKKIK